MYTSLERSINAKKQLRDKYGKWIFMGGRAKWFDAIANLWRVGKVTEVFSDGANIRETSSGKVHKVPRNNIEVITAKATLPSKGEDTAAPQVKENASKTGLSVAVDSSHTKHATDLRPGDRIYGRVNGNPPSSGVVKDGLTHYHTDGQVWEIVEVKDNGSVVKAVLHAPDGEVGGASFAKHAKARVIIENDALDAAIDDYYQNTKTEDEDGPTDISSWTKKQNLGGSTGAALYEDEEGNQYVVKFPDENKAKNEILANRFYNALGVDAPQTELISQNGKIGIASPFIPNQGDMSKHIGNAEIRDRVAKGFVADAYLANWDFAGLGNDNIVIDNEGNPIRIDNGGALLYRAMGTPKGDLFGEKVGELSTLRTSDQGKQFYANLTDEQIKESGQAVANLSDAEIDTLVDSVDFDDATSQELKSKLKARRDYIKSTLGVQEQAEVSDDTSATPVQTTSGWEKQKADALARWQQTMAEWQQIKSGAAPQAFEILEDSGDNGDGYHASGPWGKYGAAGVLIAAPNSNGETTYLIVQRGPDVSSNKGKWQLPGGAVNSKENAYQGAARETHEELGFTQEQLNTLQPVGEVIYDNGQGWQYTNITAMAPEPWKAEVDSTETGDSAWLTEHELQLMKEGGLLHPEFANRLDDILATYNKPDGSPAVVEQPDANAPDEVHDSPLTVGDTITTKTQLDELPVGSEMELHDEETGQVIATYTKQDNGAWQSAGSPHTVSKWGFGPSTNDLVTSDLTVSKVPGSTYKEEPLADWEKELLQGVQEPEEPKTWTNYTQVGQDIKETLKAWREGPLKTNYKAYQMPDGQVVNVVMHGSAGGVDLLDADGEQLAYWSPAQAQKDSFPRELEKAAFGEEPTPDYTTPDGLNALPAGTQLTTPAHPDYIATKNEDGTWNLSWVKDTSSMKNVTSDMLLGYSSISGNRFGPVETPEAPAATESEPEIDPQIRKHLLDAPLGTEVYDPLSGKAYTKYADGWHDVDSGASVGLSQVGTPNAEWYQLPGQKVIYTPALGTEESISSTIDLPEEGLGGFLRNLLPSDTNAADLPVGTHLAPPPPSYDGTGNDVLPFWTKVGPNDWVLSNSLGDKQIHSYDSNVTEWISNDEGLYVYSPKTANSDADAPQQPAANIKEAENGELGVDADGKQFAVNEAGDKFKIGDIVKSKQGVGKIEYFQKGMGHSVKVTTPEGQSKFWQVKGLTPGTDADFPASSQKFQIYTDDQGKQYVKDKNGKAVYVGDTVTSTGAKGYTGTVTALKPGGQAVLVLDPSDGKSKLRQVTKIEKVPTEDESSVGGTPITDVQQLNDLPVGSVIQYTTADGPITRRKDANGKWHRFDEEGNPIGIGFSSIVLQGAISNGTLKLISTGDSESEPTTKTYQPGDSIPSEPQAFADLPVGTQVTSANSGTFQKTADDEWRLLNAYGKPNPFSYWQDFEMADPDEPMTYAGVVPDEPEEVQEPEPQVTQDQIDAYPVGTEISTNIDGKPANTWTKSPDGTWTSDGAKTPFASKSMEVLLSATGVTHEVNEPSYTPPPGSTPLTKVQQMMDAPKGAKYVDANMPDLISEKVEGGAYGMWTDSNGNNFYPNDFGSAEENLTDLYLLPQEPTTYNYALNPGDTIDDNDPDLYASFPIGTEVVSQYGGIHYTKDSDGMWVSSATGSAYTDEDMSDPEDAMELVSFPEPDTSVTPTYAPGTPVESIDDLQKAPIGSFISVKNSPNIQNGWTKVGDDQWVFTGETNSIASKDFKSVITSKLIQWGSRPTAQAPEQKQYTDGQKITAQEAIDAPVGATLGFNNPAVNATYTKNANGEWIITGSSTGANGKPASQVENAVDKGILVVKDADTWNNPSTQTSAPYEPGTPVESVDALKNAPVGSVIYYKTSQQPDYGWTKTPEGKWLFNGATTSDPSETFKSAISDNGMIWGPAPDTPEGVPGTPVTSVSDLGNAPVGTVIYHDKYPSNDWTKNAQGTWDYSKGGASDTDDFFSMAINEGNILWGEPKQSSTSSGQVTSVQQLEDAPEGTKIINTWYDDDVDVTHNDIWTKTNGKWYADYDPWMNTSSDGFKSQITKGQTSFYRQEPTQLTGKPESVEQLKSVPVGTVVYTVKNKTPFEKINEGTWKNTKTGTEWATDDFDSWVENDNLTFDNPETSGGQSDEFTGTVKSVDQLKSAPIGTMVYGKTVTSYKKTGPDTWEGTLTGHEYSTSDLNYAISQGGLTFEPKNTPTPDETTPTPSISVKSKDKKDIFVGDTVVHPVKGHQGTVTNVTPITGEDGKDKSVVTIQTEDGKKYTYQARFVNLVQSAQNQNTAVIDSPEPVLTKDPSSPWYEKPMPEEPALVGEPRTDFDMPGLLDEISAGYTADPKNNGKQFTNSSHYNQWENLTKNGSSDITATKNEAKYGPQADVFEFFQKRGYISEETAAKARAHFQAVKQHNLDIDQQNAALKSKYDEDLTAWKVANGIPLSSFAKETYTPTTVDKIKSLMAKMGSNNVAAKYLDGITPDASTYSAKDKHAFSQWQGGGGSYGSPGDPDYLPYIEWSSLSEDLRMNGKAGYENPSLLKKDHAIVAKAITDAIMKYEVQDDFVITRNGKAMNFVSQDSQHNLSPNDLKALQGTILTDYGIIAGSPGDVAGYGSGDTVIRIRVPKGAHIGWMGGKVGINVGENEVLLPPGSRFLVHSYTPNVFPSWGGQGKGELILDLVPEGWTPAAGQTTKAQAGEFGGGGPGAGPAVAPDANL